MARQTFNPGALPDGAGGDTNRTAHQKWDSNFGELYEQVGGFSNGLSTEATARQNADIAEATARQNADISLSGRISLLGGFKNKIINGDFRHWRRGSNFPSATGARFTCERWYAVGTGSSISVSIGSSAGSAIIPNSRNTLSATVSSVAGANNSAYLQTKLEGVETLSGGKACLSFKARCNSGTFKMGCEFAQNFGTSGSSQLNTIGDSVTLTATMQTFKIVVDLPAVSGKVIGANNNLQLTFWLDAGTALAPRSFSTGQKSGAVEIAEVQLERGEFNTDYEFLPDAISTELCNWFFRTGVVAVRQNGVSGPAAGAGTFLPFVMRATPTFSFSSTNYIYGCSSINGVAYSNSGFEVFVSATGAYAFNTIYTLDAEI